MSVHHNVAFDINLHSLDDPKDLRADENKVWKCMGAPIAFINLHKYHGGVPEVKRCTKMGAHPHQISRIGTSLLCFFSAHYAMLQCS